MKFVTSVVVLLALVAGSYSWSLGSIVRHILGNRNRPTVVRQNQNEVVNMDSSWTKPDFCNKLDCPVYTRLNKTEDYEIRRYAKSGWVSTNMLKYSYSKASRMMFMNLFGYIQGANVAHEKIAMTAPVTMLVIPGQGPACEQNFTMSFYVSGDFSDAPRPTNQTVFLRQAPAFTAYVKEFGGFAFSYDTWRQQALDLARAIGDETLYHTDFYLTAGYNSPFKLLNRHNEIWFIKK